MKKLDIIIIAFFVSVAVGMGAFFLMGKKNNYGKKYAEIYVNGEFYKRIDLTDKNKKESFNIKTDLGENIVEVEDGGIRIIDADCPDEICVKDGFKDEGGDVIVCLPHKVIIEIKGENNSKIDGVSY